MTSGNRNNKTKFIFITGGVISGIGKGIVASSLGRLLISCGYSIRQVKIDPYLNEDAGTMNPFQHGEVFVTDDGAETDLDLGHYERFTSVSLTKKSNFTSGSVFRAVLDKERNGSFLGKTIQFVPHITDEIQRRILEAAEKDRPDFLLVEIGGTMGADIEIQPFAEAMRQMALKFKSENRFLNIHVVKIDYVFPSDEAKTKPIQHSVRAMLSLGLQPDVLVVRAKRPIEEENLQKISLFCSIPRNRVVEALDAVNIYEIPLALEEKGLLKAVLGAVGMKTNKKCRLDAWAKQYKKTLSKKRVVIGMVGKYHNHPDAYISVNEALHHAAAANNVSVKIVPIDSERTDLAARLKKVDAIVVPGGYGYRGVPGIIKAIRFSRENKIPFLGLCYGLQIAIVEWCQNMLGWKDAASSEFGLKTDHPVIDILDSQKDLQKMGGTQRLGAYPAELLKGSLVWRIYKPWHKGRGSIEERHRHRFEVNPKYHRDIFAKGMVFSGLSPNRELVEFIELPQKSHPFFVATQAHPEFKSRFMEPHPLFAAFVAASKTRQGKMGK
ncbi:MAG: CTP synthase [Patescibacteria group bacterium]|nr:CTP synthase [Patescibacteria group bacterium]MCL5262009.1 CTP synthase [Patescibacteria group bacterium]